MESKHLHRYIGEFAERLSDAAAGAVEMMGDVARNIVGKRLTCRRRIAGKPPCGSP